MENQVAGQSCRVTENKGLYSLVLHLHPVIATAASKALLEKKSAQMKEEEKCS